MVPDLSKLPHLTQINLVGNNLTGPVPKSLIDKSNNGKLQLSLDNYLVNTISESNASKENNKCCPVRIIAPTAIPPVLFVILLFGVIVVFWWKRKQRAPSKNEGSGISKNLSFSFSETSNILLNEKLQVKIADFGLSRAFTNESVTHITTTPAGTYGYMDPQVHISGNFSKKSDVYSFGIILLELISGKPAVASDASGTWIGTQKWALPRI